VAWATCAVPLSGWTTNNLTQGTNLDLLLGEVQPAAGTLDAVFEHLSIHRIGALAEIARAVGEPEKAVAPALHRLSQRGQVIYDFGARAYRFRQVVARDGEAMLGSRPSSPRAASFVGHAVKKEREDALGSGAPSRRRWAAGTEAVRRRWPASQPSARVRCSALRMPGVGRADTSSRPLDGRGRREIRMAAGSLGEGPGHEDGEMEVRQERVEQRRGPTEAGRPERRDRAHHAAALRRGGPGLPCNPTPDVLWPRHREQHRSLANAYCAYRHR
jgi:hypothetical protein